MPDLTLRERELLADRLKMSSGFLVHFINVALIRPELSDSSIRNGKELVAYLENIPEALPVGFGFKAIIKIYNYAKDSGLDAEAGVYWKAWEAELSENTLAYCTHTHTIDADRRKEKKAEYEYKFQVWDDGKTIEEDVPHNFEDYKVPFLHEAANVMDFKPKGSWLSADITFNKGGEITA